jgi:hypothetical protein
LSALAAAKASMNSVLTVMVTQTMYMDMAADEIAPRYRRNRESHNGLARSDGGIPIGQPAHDSSVQPGGLGRPAHAMPTVPAASWVMRDRSAMAAAMDCCRSLRGDDVGTAGDGGDGVRRDREVYSLTISRREGRMDIPGPSLPLRHLHHSRSFSRYAREVGIRDMIQAADQERVSSSGSPGPAGHVNGANS